MYYMTNEEAINTIKTAIAEVEWYYPMDYAIAFEIAISALEKQTPKKPKECGEDWFVCPKCETSIVSLDELETHKFCPNCGKWIPIFMKRHRISVADRLPPSSVPSCLKYPPELPRVC